MRPFAGDECIHALSGGLFQITTAPPDQ
jgi:hypothetical protein